MINLLAALLPIAFASLPLPADLMTQNSQAFNNPAFDEMYSPYGNTDNPLDGEPDWSRDLVSQNSEIRIKIFPHNSKYNSPQGQDSVINQATVTSDSDCNLYRADNPTSEGGLTKTHLVRTGSSFNVTPRTVPYPMWIECAGPFRVTRPDYPKNPISYTGLAFIKTVNSDSGDYVTIVNVLPFEEYLKGVVPSEMPASWSAEALKVQAIAARTYAFHELGSKVNLQDGNIMQEQSGAQFDDTVTYQAYLGLKNTTAATNQAVNDTAGQVLVYQGKVVKAYFSADSGGYTENAENVWGKYYPYILGKAEIYPAGSVPGSDWTYTAPIKEVQDKMIANNLMLKGEVLSDISIDPDDLFPSTRPHYISLSFTNNSLRKVLGVDFAHAMNIKSAWIKISSARKRSRLSGITITGKGFGHGAGMSQWGSRIMVDKLNKNYDEILKFYYTGVDITPVMTEP
ncbi:MAG: SpoIID/LytB domain-containing protein [Pseudobdellovibrio sp.]